MIIKPTGFKINNFTEFNKKYPKQRSQMEILLDHFFKVKEEITPIHSAQTQKDNNKIPKESAVKKSKVDLVPNGNGFVIEAEYNDTPLRNVYFCYAISNDIIKFS